MSHEVRWPISELPSSVGETVTAWLDEPIPQDAMERVQQQALGLEGKPARARSNGRWTWAPRMIGVAAAAVAIAAVWHWSAGRSIYAQVSRAVRERPWLHAKGAGPGSKPMELWLSGRLGVSARILDGIITYTDLEAGRIDTWGGTHPWDPTRVSRVIFDERALPVMAQQRDTLKMLLSGDYEVALGPGTEMVTTTDRRVVVEGVEAIELRVVLKQPSAGDLVHRFVIDPAKMVPFRWIVEEGSRVLMDCWLDYPEAGPASIYDVGAPSSAVIVVGKNPE